MAVQWDKYHVHIVKGLIRIVRGSIKKNGLMDYESYSDDKTDEVIRCVAAKMKYDLDKREDNRGYVGYDIPHVGKLVLVKDGYEFFTKKTE